MKKIHTVKGFCPVKGKNILVKVTYVFNLNRWEKGICEPPCSHICENGCPILDSAPDELRDL